MPVEFQPLSIPLTQGAREDLSDLQVEDPSALQVAENVLFTRSGAVRARPAQTPRDQGSAITYVAGVATAGTFADATGSRTPAGIVRVPGLTESPLALYQSRALRFRDTYWTDVGPFWSTRKTVSSADFTPDSTSTGAPTVSVGDNVVVASARANTGIGLPWLDDEGNVTAVVGTVAPKGGVAVGDRVLYVDGTTLKMQIPGTFPSYTTATIATLCDFASITACAGNGTGVVFCLVQGSGLPFDVRLMRIDAAGTVTHTLTFAGAGFGINSRFSIAYNGLDSILIGYAATAIPGSIHTRVVSVISWATVAGWDNSYPITTASAVPIGVIVGIAGATPYVAGTDPVTGNMWLHTRWVTGTPFSSTLWTLYGTLLGPGAVAGKGPSVTWKALFQPGAVGSRVFFGVQRISGQPLHPTVPGYNTGRQATWYVVDVRCLEEGGRAAIVAAGVDDASAAVEPGTATFPGDSSVRFGVVEGRTFNADGSLQRSAAVRVELAPVGARSRESEGSLLFSGSAPYRFDGHTTAEMGFMEIPKIRTNTQVIHPPPGVGTGLADGSYSYQVVWTALDGTGRMVRSPSSDILTVAVSGGGGYAHMDINVSVPQLGTYPAVTVELYATVVNPSAGADKYLVASQAVTLPSATGNVTLTHGYTPAPLGFDVGWTTDPTQQALYTGGDVIDDERPPAGDRGIAVVGDRIWVADQRRLYASRLPDVRYAPAWNTAGFLALQIPSALGQVESLASMGDRLIVLCSAGVLVVVGAGFDNIGNGTGWQAQEIAQVGCAPGPRVSAETSRGVCFIGVDGEVYLVDQGLSVNCISRPVREQAEIAKDLTYVAGGLSVGEEITTNPLLVVGGYPLRVLDLETGQWSTWKTGNTIPAPVVEG